MKGIFRSLTLLIFAAASASPALTQCVRHVEPAGGFSYCPPVGWKLETRPNEEYKWVVGKVRMINFAVIDLNTLLPQMALDDLEAKKDEPLLPGQTRKKLLSRSEFTTTSGMKGIKLVYGSSIKGMPMLFPQYFFAGKGGRRMMVFAVFLEKDKGEVEPVIDGVIKTMNFK